MILKRSNILSSCTALKSSDIRCTQGNFIILFIRSEISSTRSKYGSLPTKSSLNFLPIFSVSDCQSLKDLLNKTFENSESTLEVKKIMHSLLKIDSSTLEYCDCSFF